MVRIPISFRAKGIWHVIVFALLLFWACPGLTEDNKSDAATNGQEVRPLVEIPPEVEALFPKDIPFNQKAYERYTQSNKTSPFWEKRVHRDFSTGIYKGVCLDYHINLELYGGEFFLGAVLPPVHPEHPRKDKFRYVVWDKLNVVENVPIIRKYFYCLGERTQTPLEDTTQIWRAAASTVRELIRRGKIILEHAELDVNDDGTAEDVYRVIFLNSSIVHRPDGACGYRSNIFMVGRSNLAKLFNKNIKLHREPFYYDDILYFATNGAVYQGVQSEYGGKVRNQFYYKHICSLLQDK